MKKILLLLLLATFGTQAQTLQNPTFGNVKLKNNTTDNSATKVNVQSTDGTINTISKFDLVNVVEVNDVPSLPLVGEVGKIYVVKNVNKIYRWNGTFYQELAGSDISGLQAQIDLKANNSDVVKLTGNQTISGQKSFSLTGKIDMQTDNAFPAISVTTLGSNGQSAVQFINNSSYPNSAALRLQTSTSGGVGNMALYVSNQSPIGTGILSNASNGGVSISSQSGDGDSYVSNITSGGTGRNYVGRNDGTETYSVDKTGNVIGNSYIKRSTPVNNILLAGGGDLAQASLPVSTATQTALNGKENIANKQNSLAVDGTGVKFPTVDATNAGLATKVTSTGTTNRIPKFTSSNSLGDSGLIQVGGNIGMGSAVVPGELFHIGDGNILLEGGGEVAQKFKRDFTTTGENLGVPTGSGISVNPIFQVGRIIQAGDGDPEIRIMYSDDNTSERTVFEVDRKGIAASVKTSIGSHFEGFASLTDVNPKFRLNSYPRMRLEMGAGGNDITDVAVERGATGSLDFFTNSAYRGGFDSSGNLNLLNTPTAPTAPAGTNTTQIATTAFVNGGLATKENAFSKNTAFNKNFGTTAGTVAEGNDSRINNGQTSFGWGNHAGLYPSLTGAGANGTWGINISGSASSATNWGGISANFVNWEDTPQYLLGTSAGVAHYYNQQYVRNFLGLGSNAYNSTAYLPLSGGTLGGAISGTSATFSSSVEATQYKISALNTAPASATATGTTGEIRITAGFIYICIATNTWVRAALTTWI